MNKDLQNQIPVDDQPLASKLYAVAEDMNISPNFQYQLESQLMEAHKMKTQPAQGWYTKFTLSAGWAVLALGGIFLLSWAIRSLIPNLTPAQEVVPEISFAENVRQGNICTGPLAIVHGFAAFLTNSDKSGFVNLDAEKAIGELRSIMWASDGSQLALVGNTTGRGNIYLTDPAGKALQSLFPDSEIGYLRDAAWSQDGQKFVMWSGQNNTVIHLVNADGTGLTEKQLNGRVFATPQFTPDHEGLIYYGADSDGVPGLLELRLDSSQSRMISPLVEDESGFAWSPDGSRLAYMEMDRNRGEARLVADEITTGKITLATLPIPTGSGSSIPEAANLGWSADGQTLVFEFGRGVTDRAIYIAYADGTGLIKVAEAAYAPSLSADGCLAYISNQQVFLMDLANLSQSNPEPLLLADMPGGRVGDFRLDKLQWWPGISTP